MTDRLYYTDPYLKEFDATVVRAAPLPGGLAVTLDRTAFYPTSGGQPFDTGMLAGCPVIDVVDLDDGSVEHHVAWGPAPTGESGSDPKPSESAPPSSLPLVPGQHVHGEIDWARRFDHMQQHTGQHVLSAAFERLHGVRTVSFHLGTTSSTIDLARDVSAAEIAAAETEANRIVWEDRPVSIRFASAEEAARLPLRKEPQRGGTLRLIDVERFDLSACGGTHVARTGAIGTIAVASWERFKGGLRLEFLCGGRALDRFRALRDTVGGAVRLLSVLPQELPGAIERMQAESREQKRASTALQEEVARHRAEELAAAAEAHPAGRLVLRTIDADAAGLKALATAIAAKPGHVVVLASAAKPALVVVARSADVKVAAQQVLAALTKRFGGRGGGRPELAQGGGLDATPEAVLGAARDLLATS